MNATASPDETLRAENAELRARLEEAEETLRAIRAGEVDALMVDTSAGPKLFILQGADAQQSRMRGEMLAQVSDAVIATDLDQNVTFVNLSAERQMGIRAGDVLGRALAGIYSEQWENPAAEAAMRTALHERGECRCELIHHMHDGHEMQVEKSIATLRAPDGTPTGYVKAIRDVTYRKTLEQEKSEALRLLDTLLTHAPVGFAFFDRELRFVRINERLAELNGLSVAAHLGRTVAEIVPTLETTLREVTARILATGRPVLDHEFAGETAGAPGVTRYWRQSWYPVSDVRGEIMGFGAVVEDITESKQAEERLRHNERRFRGIFDSAFQYIGLMTPDGTLLEANRTSLEGGGLRAENVIGKPFWECNWWTLTERTGRELRTAIGRAACGELVRYDVDVRGAEGQVVTIDFSIKPIRDEAGRVVLLVPEGRDITDLKRAEESLRITNQRFDLAVKCSQVVLWQQDLELRFTWLHNAAPGIDGSNPVGKRDADLLELAEDADVIVALKREVIRSGVGLRQEFSPQIQGVRYWFELLMEPLRDAAGLITGLTGAAIDITERKRAETALKVSEVRYRRLFETAKDGILILDADTATIAHANPFMAEMLGYSQDEYLGKELWEFGLFKDAEANKEAMRELQKNGYIHYEDLPLKNKAGQRINVEFVSNVYGEEGEAVIQCNIRDISDRKRLEQILQQRAADLSEADHRKDEFLATLAHELRNPLAPIRTAVEVLRMKGPAIPELQWARDVIDRQMQVMTRLIDDLMDVSRINQGKIELQREQVELRKIVQGAVETSRPLIEEMGHELTVTLPPGPVILDVDLTRMAQVFMNLLNNAAKYTERAGRIDLRAELQGSDVVVSVKDTGIGLAAEKLPTLFEMFSQVEGALSRAQGGLGIGLCLVKRLVEMHGGSVEAKSGGLGKGSEFVVRLPIVVERTYPRPASHDGDEAKSTSDLRILVVDDNRDGANTLAMMLKVMGNETRTAYDGEEAVAAAGEFRPHVVLCDIGLPKLNGYEACRQMKAHAWDKKMILIAVTGWGQDDDRRKSEAAGFDHHLVKPVDLQALMKLLAGLDSVKA